MTRPTLLDAVDQLDPLIDASHHRPVLIFKHSLTCPVSTAAYREYLALLEERPDDGKAAFALIEIQRARDVSNEVAARSQVRHESPQAILLYAGRAVWHASHWSIHRQALATALDAAVAGATGAAAPAALSGG